ncbi:AraC family transcriptional regulator [Niabella pedocola]|uniref:AraC family transcriptional regulator n=1 Tax=Niabella pedocola TaxID=1752077 RepID=A0ABS8PKC3_9BACT|nr:helix-turn-helix domain-containing protein [Niabella pedocola]MCD2421548.1 AraC family transcriptional regulator [Niabella pedocola]
MAKKKESIITEYHLNPHRPDQPQLAFHDLGSYLKQYQHDTTRPHIHSFYQLIWFRQGMGKHFVDFKAYDVYRDTLFFIAKNQVHYFDQQTHYKGILIHFNELLLGNNDHGFDFLVNCSLFNNPYQTPCCSVGKDMAILLETYLQLIKTELDYEEGFAREELLRIYLKAFLIQLQRGKQVSDKQEGKTAYIPDEKRVQLLEFVDLVNRNYDKGFSVAQYADLLHVSSRTLSDLTHQTLGKTPSQIIQERIILEAQRLLLHSNLNVNQIGYRLGFDDPSYFVKYFKKHTHTSPSEFRRAVS